MLNEIACQPWAKSQKKINGKMEVQATWKPVSKWTTEEEEEEEEEAASMEAEEEEAASTEEEEEEAASTEEEEEEAAMEEEEGEEEEAASTAATPEVPQGAGVPSASALRGAQTSWNTVNALEERYVTSPRRSRRLGKRKKATPPPPPAKKRVRRQPARVRTLRTLGL
eukprot:g3893.t1